MTGSPAQESIVKLEDPSNDCEVPAPMMHDQTSASFMTAVGGEYPIQAAAPVEENGLSVLWSHNKSKVKCAILGGRESAKKN